MRRNPRHVYLDIRERKRAPHSDLERSLFVKLHGAEALNQMTPSRPWDKGCIIDPSLKYPYEVFDDEQTRGVMEAFLIASPEDHTVGTALDMPIEEVNAYRQLFFDTRAFKTDLDLMLYMKGIPEDSPSKQLFRIAYHQGIGALRWQFCRDKGDISPADVVKTIMTDSFFRSLEHRGQSITSKAAKEAAKMANAALAAARVILVENDAPDADIESLRMRFEEIKNNRSIKDLEAAGEELVH